MMIRLIQFVSCIYLPSLILSSELSIEIQPKKNFLLTIPKSGTHLLAKAVKLITGAEFQYLWPPEFELNSLIIKPQPQTDQYIWRHLIPQFHYLKDDFLYKKILLIRDPRDILVSQVNHIIKRGRMKLPVWWEVPEDFVEKFMELTFSEQLNAVIEFPTAYHGIESFLHRTMIWMRQPNPTVLVVRFEDLVGPKGGGDSELQKKTLQEIARHLGYELSPESINDVADNLFGDTETFREGKIGSWQDNFCNNNKRLFKKIMGDYLIELGYEKDNNW